MNKMTSLEAKQIADKYNKPIIESYLMAHPLEEILEVIKTRASQGMYSLDQDFPEETSSAVVQHIARELMKLGYDTRVNLNHLKKKKNWSLRIEWERV